ncbi:hypothetical protein SAMN06296020_104125 [Anoxynatronum buryatiense]|uniref:Uncharacterized protein n=1 Tax=Anoxynatronum buryatiense TaxID=489973 RepID=A0AA46AIL7_9CLOT|nr:hypothetical protein SAMN06296020_104125 [Anoxynatronum buryatiense]
MIVGLPATGGSATNDMSHIRRPVFTTGRFLHTHKENLYMHTSFADAGSNTIKKDMRRTGSWKNGR